MSHFIGEPEGLQENSPGQRPGLMHTLKVQALKGRDKGLPGALLRPFRAWP